MRKYSVKILPLWHIISIYFVNYDANNEVNQIVKNNSKFTPFVQTGTYIITCGNSVQVHKLSCMEKNVLNEKKFYF